MNIEFIEGPKDGTVITEDWIEGGSALVERFNRGMWWWGACADHGEGMFLYIEEHPRDQRDFRPPKNIRLIFCREANEDQIDLFRSF